MKYVKSCGFVVFKRIEDSICFLIINSVNGDYGFPKGHMESNESELETANRELLEETNIEVNVIGGFKKEIEYRITYFEDVIKRCTYFLGEYKNGNLKPQIGEVMNLDFYSYEKALEMLSFADTKNILIEAKKYIEKVKL